MLRLAPTDRAAENPKSLTSQFIFEMKRTFKTKRSQFGRRNHSQSLLEVGKVRTVKAVFEIDIVKQIQCSGVRGSTGLLILMYYAPHPIRGHMMIEVNISLVKSITLQEIVGLSFIDQRNSSMVRAQ